MQVALLANYISSAHAPAQSKMYAFKKAEPLRDGAERTSGGERRVRGESGCFEWRIDLDSELVTVVANCLKCLYATKL